jgi:citronellol/citronellal dehydrogenase
VLRAEGMTDFSRYAPGNTDKPLQGDFFVPDAVFDRSPTKIKRGF